MELIQLIKRELKVTYHRSAEVFNIFVFFMIIGFAFSFAAAGNISLQLATSIIIVCFMLSSHLSSHLIFEKDIESGVLQQLFMRVKNLNNLIFAKMISQYLCFGIPLIIGVPVVSIFFSVASASIFPLMAAIAITSLVISVINVMMAGITAGLKGGGIISIILAIPFYIPVIILNISYIESGVSAEQAITFPNFAQNMLAFMLIITPLAVFSIRQALRNAVGD